LQAGAKQLSELFPRYCLTLTCRSLLGLSCLICFSPIQTSSASTLTTSGSTRQQVSGSRQSVPAKIQESDLDLQDQGNKDRALHNYSKAIDAYTHALEKSQHRPPNERASIYFDRAIAFDLSNHSSDATRDFKEALKLYQDYVRTNPEAEDLGPVSFAMNNINAQLSLRNSSERDEETYTRNITSRRWPEKRFPLRIHIDSSSASGFDPTLQGLVKSAITEWASVPGVYFRWVPVPDARGADIVVSRGNEQNQFVDNASQTGFEYKEDDNQVSEISVVRVKVFCPSDRATDLSPEVSAELYASLLHAFGHAFGVDGHSANGSDVMYWKSSTGHLSARDKAAFRQIYE
jgi:tetratricopeptide (TPR) repeat protein